MTRSQAAQAPIATADVSKAQALPFQTWPPHHHFFTCKLILLTNQKQADHHLSEPLLHTEKIFTSEMVAGGSR